MSLLSKFKQPVKNWRWRRRRAAVVRRYSAKELDNAPIVIGNAMPKSGSHLLSQVLLGLAKIGPFVDPGMPPLTRSADNKNLSAPQVLERIRALQSGDLAYAYLHARPPYIKELAKDKVAAFFIYRDPRDMLVSHVFYATDLHPEHGMHTFYNRLNTMEERLNVAIEGVQEEGAQLSPIRQKYEHYLGWLDQPEVHSLRFEDLILKRKITLAGMLRHLAKSGFVPQMSKEEALSSLASVIAPAKSGTFRRGQPGEWREHFTDENITRFKSATGDLLQRLGYEKKANWR